MADDTWFSDRHGRQLHPRDITITPTGASQISLADALGIPGLTGLMKAPTSTPNRKEPTP